MEEEYENFKISADQQRSSLQSQNRSLVQEIAKLKSELARIRSQNTSLDSNLSRDVAKASGPVRQVPAGVQPLSQKCAAKVFGPNSKVPADIPSKQKLASMASVPVRRVPPAQQGARAPEQNHAVAFMTAVVESTSEIAPKKVVRNRSGFQVEQNHGHVSEKVTDQKWTNVKEDNRGGRPVPGSSSFVRANQMDTSTAQVKKILSGDYLTFYMGNLSYRANDVTLKTAIEHRFPITVDQAVVAYSSDGRSRGCAFVTVRWKEYLNSHSDSNSQSLVQKFCHSMTGKPLFGRPVFVELACNQRRGG
jgi:hypothetical protein